MANEQSGSLAAFRELTQQNTQGQSGSAQSYWPGNFTAPCPYCGPRCPCCGRLIGYGAQPWWPGQGVWWLSGNTSTSAGFQQPHQNMG